MKGVAVGRSSLKSAAAVGVPLLLLLGQTVLKIHYGLNLADEGFLWYGAQRTLAGEVPIRDFMAYDPGRYYWTALWMWLARDDGIVAMRWSAVIFEAIAVGAASFAVLRQTRSVAVAVLSGATCVLLIGTWHGRYEPSIALLQVVVLARFLEKESDAKCFVAGLQVGLSAFFGRNLALYGLLGLLAVLALQVFWDRRIISWRRLALLGAGGIVGALPLAVMLALTPGFAAAFWSSILRHFELGATNLPLPLPWPWAMQYHRYPWSIRVAMFLYATLHLAFLIVGGGAAAWAILKNPRLVKENSLFTAAGLLSLPYAHYAFSRASMEHLIRAGAPLILALAIVPCSRRRGWRVLPALLLASALAYIRPIDLHGVRVVTKEPSVSPADWLAERNYCQLIMAGTDRLCVEGHLAQTVEGARLLVGHFVRPGESVLVAPFDPGLYPLLGLKAPNWEIFALFPARPEFEMAEIRRIEAARTRLAIVAWWKLDGRPDLHFRATHPITTHYLTTRYELVREEVLPPGFLVFARP